MRVLAITGAGISAESGIPTFRGKDGYWRNHDPRQLTTQQAFDRDPLLVWDWYRERRRLIRRSEPNAAHRALTSLAQHTRDFLLLTQNVDDLDLRAGMPTERMVQIHGRIFDTICTQCSFRRDAGEADDAGVPTCPKCAAPLRPGVVWFDEMLDENNLRRVEMFLQSGPCDRVLVIGTTAVFGYIVRWALLARGAQGRLIEINPEPTALSPHADETIRQPAAVALPALLASSWP